MNTKTLQNVALAAITALAVAALCATSDPNPEAEYCDMVRIYKESNGAYGWPAYKGEEICE